jgi:hypothetical protein
MSWANPFTPRFTVIGQNAGQERSFDLARVLVISK